MHGRFSRLAIVAALAAIAALFVWLPNVLVSRAPLVETDRRHEPDYTIDNFTATAMDVAGRRKYQLRAVRLDHYPDTDSSELVRPYLIQFSPDAPPLHTRADRGTLQGAGKEILMRGNVRMTRSSAPNAPAGEVATQEMRVLLE